MKKTHHGSCACGTIGFEVELDLAAGTTRCNCSFCRKARMWFALVPAAALRVTRGADQLADFQRTVPGKSEPFLHFHFCRSCGVRPFSKGGAMPAMGGEFYAVNVACLDDASDGELAAAPIKYADGRNDDLAHPPAEHRYL